MDKNKGKFTTVEEALELVGKNCNIVTGLGASEARLFLSQLHRVYSRIENVNVANCLPMTEFEFFKKEYSDKFFVDGWFYSPTMRKMHGNGNASFIPNHLHFAGSRRLSYKRPNIYVGVCSQVDRHGYVSLSTGNTYEKEMIDCADHIILEANANFPRTFGDVQIHISEIDALIEADYLPPEIADVEPGEKDLVIGKYISDEILDGSCIQLGIGGIPNAVAKSLYSKKDLGVHTEMLTSEMAKLAKAGVINGRRKNLYNGKMVTTFILGDKELYDFVDDNTAVMVLAGSYVNNPSVVAQNNNMVSINTALEVDLTGQVSSESIGSRQFSGTGGQSDTAVGAQNSKGGKSFIALYSTAMVKNPLTGEKEEKSKIASVLTPGSAVTLHRSDVDRVVTEYGIANLSGRDIYDRVQELIKIAHPKFRDDLYREAYKLGIIAKRIK